MRPRDAIVALGSLALLSCATSPSVPTDWVPPLEAPQDPTLSPLTWAGGISVIGGILIMTATRSLGLPMRGQIPLLVGILLVVGTWAIQVYMNVVVLPIAITAGVLASMTLILSFVKLLKEHTCFSLRSLFPLPQLFSRIFLARQPDQPHGTG